VSRLSFSFSRRDFLKVAGGAALSVAFKPFWSAAQPQAEPPPGLGRATWPLYAYARPSFRSQRLGQVHFDTVFTIYESAIGDSFPHNRIWFRMDQGWVHSSSVQVVRNILNKPVLDVRPGGFLAEVTVPITPTWYRLGEQRGVPSNFYYSAAFLVEEAVQDSSGRVWYRVFDDFNLNYFVSAEHLRPIPDTELTPLSPGVSDKQIKIDLDQQHLTAYEQGRVVFACQVASGLPGSETPRGQHRVLNKRPSRHMATGTVRTGPAYNLPGVAWCSFFTDSGAALHATYWHNDYGRRNSAGCVNLFPDNAKWLYRWTLPSAGPLEKYVTAENGTEVIVF